MYCVCEKIEVKGFIGQTFPALINGSYAEISITVETQHGIITKIIDPCISGRERSYLIKFMGFQYPIEVEEDYITKCCDHCKPCC